VTADRLRRALATHPISRLDTSRLEAAYRISPGALREAAVLVPVYFDGEAAHVLMTRRRNDLRLHPGQISWPGGRIDPDDVDSRAAALREAHEEIGLDPRHVEVVGRLGEALAVLSGFRLTPWVGVVPYPYPYVAQPSEVAGLVELPVAGLLAPGAHRIEKAEAFGMVHEVDTFEIKGEVVWGASARILHELLTVWRSA